MLPANLKDSRQAPIVVVMGVAGCGKSSVASKLADALNASFLDADDLHPDTNIAKMSAGIPLTDDDRAPWLAIVREESRKLADANGALVVACSALKLSYREMLNHAGAVSYVHLQGSFDLIYSRMSKREGHFMPESMLESQFLALEDPSAEQNVVTVNIDQTIDAIVDQALQGLAL